MKKLLGIVFFFFAITAWGQTDNDIQLAQHYYSQGDFDKALEYYEKIYNQSPTTVYFKKYYQCLIETEAYKKAEKVVKKEIAKSPKNIDLKIQLALFYEERGQGTKAKKIYQDLIDNHTSSPSECIALFNSFLYLSNLEYAEMTLVHSQKKFKSYPFNFQSADLFAQKNDKAQMIESYLLLLDKHDYYDQAVQKALQKRLDIENETSSEFMLLKTALFERAKNENTATVFSEMLIWLYTQINNFSGVFNQVVAVDIRTKSNGYRLFDFALICRENKDYETAIRAFQEAKEMTSSQELKILSQKGILNVGYIKIVELNSYNQEQLSGVIGNYEEVINNIHVVSSRTLSIILEYAEILAFHAGEKQKALEVLDKTYNSSSLTDMMKAEIKMLMADIEVLNGNIWDASLMYMQISESFNYETIGNWAKFKNARIFYYEGEFEFAQSQLDILKQSTSKLLANDAIQLSVTITDNYGLDSNYIAMAWFSKADLLIEQYQFSKAFSLFDSIKINYPFHSLADEILFKRAKAMELQGNWEEAMAYYADIIKFHDSDILADDALFNTAEILETKLNKEEQALIKYKELLTGYPGSLFSHESRKRIRKLRGEDINNELDF